jgi:hypothetical protein
MNQRMSQVATLAIEVCSIFSWQRLDQRTTLDEDDVAGQHAADAGGVHGRAAADVQPAQVGALGGHRLKAEGVGHSWQNQHAEAGAVLQHGDGQASLVLTITKALTTFVKTYFEL